ncbi:MAG: hypothetical protein HZB23_00140 [Deltaproteobacteria bacterium]|nr:hypothetical protein [Deltaproteobacteria bacterium]
MKNSLMIGLWRYVINVPPVLWESQVKKTRKRVLRALEDMSPDSRRVHHYLVSKMPETGGPVGPEMVAGDLGLPLSNVLTIMDGLEKRMTFIWRNEKDEAIWAYPVTVEKTPHAITFDTGESLYAA